MLEYISLYFIQLFYSYGLTDGQFYFNAVNSVTNYMKANLSLWKPINLLKKIYFGLIQLRKKMDEGDQHSKELNQLKKIILNARANAQCSLVTLKITKQDEIHNKDGSLSMLCYFMPVLAKKQGKKVEQAASFNPFLNPDQHLLIKDLGDSHRLLFNKFNIFDNHLLVVTKNFEPQTDKITEKDMIHASTARQALDGVLFFNGGQESGASQKHKHLQILPKQANKLPIINKINQFLDKDESQEHIIRFPPFKFLHGIIQINQTNKIVEGQILFRSYQELFEELINKNKAKYAKITDYNLIATEKFILMVVRKKQKTFCDVSVNSVGFMGSLLFKNEESLQKFKAQFYPSQILEDICLI